MDDARDLELLHREEHRGRAAIMCQYFAKAAEVEQCEAHAAKLDRHVAAEQFGITQRCEGLVWQARIAIDCVGILVPQRVQLLQHAGQEYTRGQDLLHRFSPRGGGVAQFRIFSTASERD